MLTEKQNYLKMLRGEQPEWVPKFTFGPMPGSTTPVATHMFEPPLINQHRINGGGKDIWGVNYVPTYETGFALLPEPNNFILDDITKWRDIIKAPSLEGIDWETMVRKNVEDSGIDREQTALAMNLHFGYFQHLMSFMGFSEGMMAMYEEPDEVKALLNYICDFYMEVAKNTIDLYKPDILVMMDDTAAWGAPFISPEMYREFLVPCHDRWAKMGRERGLCMTMHNCGKCESVIDEFIKMGVNGWDPAQTCNDLAGIKAKYGNKIAIMGGWDGRGRLLAEDVTDEEIRESVRTTFNMLAPGGGFACSGGFMGTIGDEETKRKNGVLRQMQDELCHSFYK